MVVKFIYPNSLNTRSLNEMLGVVPENIFVRRVQDFINRRYPDFEKEATEAFNNIVLYPGNVELTFSGGLAQSMQNDHGLDDAGEKLAATFGYDFGYIASYDRDGNYTLVFKQMNRPSATFADTIYNNLYLRYTNDSPRMISRIGFRQRGHFYAYAIGRYVSLVCAVAKNAGIRLTPEEVLEYKLNEIYVKDTRRGFKGLGRYLYAFTHGNGAYIDACDADFFPDLTDDETRRIASSIKGESIRDIEKALLQETDLLQPVVITEFVPPEKTAFLWDVKGEYSGAWEKERMKALDKLIR